jgi:serine/threonine-protein kinase
MAVALALSPTATAAAARSAWAATNSAEGLRIVSALIADGENHSPHARCASGYAAHMLGEAAPSASGGLLSAAVARNTEEGRALLQTRVSMSGRLATLLTLVFGLLGGVMMTFVAPDRPGQAKLSAIHLSGTLIFGAIWLYTRRGVVPLAVLGVLDAIVVLCVTATFIVMGWNMPMQGRPDLLALFAITESLAIRAVIIPSTPRRTGVISVMCAVPVVAFTYLYYLSRSPPGWEPGPATYAYLIAVLSASVVVVSMVTSRIIYGLQEKAREALELGQYTLVEKIGEGGMGVVYRAQHAMLRRPTAIKLLPRERAGDSNLARFEREARLTSLLTHPNTVSVYDFGRTPDGVFYYAMEFLDGLDLETLVEHDGPQDAGRTIHLLAQVCGALAEAHGVGLIHRDIKPANVILCERAGVADVVKVVDFGLVKSLQVQSNGASQSAIGQIVGTPLYLSPEAITSGDGVGPQSDLYAVGAAGYFLLTGEPPFAGKTVVEICSHHLHTAPVPPSERLGRAVPAPLERLVLSCLAKSPNDRPASAAVLQAALLACPEAAHWTAERAKKWWAERGGVLRQAARAARGQARSSASPGPRTIAIDLQARAG